MTILLDDQILTFKGRLYYILIDSILFLHT